MACRQLGFPSAVGFATVGHYERGGLSMEEVKCQGSEQTLQVIPKWCIYLYYRAER